MSTLPMSTDAALAVIATAPMGPRVAAFFDFDGTLIDGYSAVAFFKHRARRFDLGPVETAHTLVAGVRGVSSTREFAQLAERSFKGWAGRSPDDLDELGERLFVQGIAESLYHDAWRLVKAHQRRGHTVVIASSACHFQIAPLARELEVEHLLCTELETRGGLLTGKLSGTPLWAAGKSAAVRTFAQGHTIDLKRSYAYSNGGEDVAFLETVGLPQAVNPDKELAKIAARRDWPVHSFAARGRSGPEAVLRTAMSVGGTLTGLGAGMTLGLLNGSRRQAVEAAASLAADLGFAAGGVEVDVQGEQHLWSHRPAVFLINHQSSMIDFLIMCRLLRRNFAGLAKKDAAKAPIFGQFLRLADFVFVERAGGDPAQLRHALDPAVDKLRSGVSILVAPEGTRSVTPRIAPFKKGAFHIAMQSQVPIVPIVIRNGGEIMWRDSKTLRPGLLQVAVLPPIDVSDWTKDDLTDRVAGVRQQYLDTLDDWPTATRRDQATGKLKVLP